MISLTTYKVYSMSLTATFYLYGPAIISLTMYNVYPMSLTATTYLYGLPVIILTTFSKMAVVILHGSLRNMRQA